MVVSNADATIANTPTNQAILTARYPKYAERIRCITNGFDPDDYKNVPAPTTDPEGSGRRMQIVYTGEIYERMGDALWKGLEILKRKDSSIADKLEIRIAGLVTDKDLRRIESTGLSSFVKYLGFAKAAECQKLLVSSDASLFLLPREGFSFWVPSKLYSYLGSRKFIIAIIPEGDASKIIEDVRAGLCIQPVPEKIADALATLVSRHSKGTLKADYDTAALEKYKRSYQSGQLADIIHEVLGAV